MSNKYEVCDRCEGEGYVSKIGSFTAADLDEWYGPDVDDFLDEYRKPDFGAYGERCPECQGKRVVRTFESLTEAEQEAYRERQEYEAEVRAEQRAMGICC